MRRASRIAGLACALVALPASQTRAQADLPSVVVLAIEGCEAPDDVLRLRRLIATELHADGVDEVLDGPGDDTAIARVDVTRACEGEAAVVRVVDLATDKRLERQVPVADVAGDARARVVAFAVAALLRASWAELVLADAPPPARDVPDRVLRGAVDRAERGLEEQLGRRLEPPAPEGEARAVSDPRPPGDAAPSPADAPVPTPTEPSPPPRSVEREASTDGSSDAGADRWQLGAMASARLFLQQPTGAVGGRVFAGLDWFRAGLSGEGGLVEGELGAVVYGLLTADAEAQALTHRFGGALDPSIALRVRASVGWARFEGQTERADVDAASLDAFVFGGDVVGALRLPLLADLALEIEVSVGGMTGAAARADGDAVATAEGLYGRVAVGLAR